MKALFVGLGSIGQRHLRNLKELKPDIELMAVRSTRSVPVLSDSNQVVSDVSIQSQYGVQEFESLDEALTHSPDMVFVTNPTSMHIDTAKQAIKSGAFLFMEKPISHNFNGVEELIEVEESFSKKKILVGYQFRFNPALRLVKETLQDGIIGNIVSAQLVNGEYMPGWHPYEDYRLSYAARNELGGGALVTQIHDFDYATWLFGPPENIFAVGGHLSDLEIDVEDSVQVLMQCSGVPITIQLDYLQHPPRRFVSITGDNGSIQCNLMTMEVIIHNRIGNSVDKYEFSDYDRNNQFLDEMKNFLAFVAGDENPVVSLKEGASSLRIALAAKKSMNTGKSERLYWD